MPPPQPLPPSSSRRTSSEAGERRRAWLVTAALLTLAGAAWAFSTPLMSGADESDHAIRAAAVVRGQPVGGATRELLGHPNVFIEVEVPEAYSEARVVSTCFIDPPDDNPDQTFQRAGEKECRSSMQGGFRTVTTTTLQYRGQPSYYAVVGLPTLIWPGAAGVTAMRVLSGAMTAALLAAALLTARSLPGSPLLPIAVLAGATPVCLWLSGQVNSGGFEIAAALLLWSSAVVLVRAEVPTGRMVTGVGLSFTLLTICRGLSPAFGLGVLAVVALVSDRARLRSLTRRRDVRIWGSVGAVATLASVAWLAFIQLRYPLDARPGTGVASALGSWDWYLRQAVGVFGVNEIVLPLPAVMAWGAVVAVIVAVGLASASGRDRAVVGLFAVGAFALNVTAEGLSFPPIGYYWQGRYVLPLLVGVAVLAAGARPSGGRQASRALRILHLRTLGVVLVVVQVWAFAFVGRYFAGRGRGDLGFLDAWRDPVWSPPLLPAWAWTVLYALAIGGTAALALGSRHPERTSVAGKPLAVASSSSP